MRTRSSKVSSPALNTRVHVTPHGSDNKSTREPRIIHGTPLSERAPSMHPAAMNSTPFSPRRSYSFEQTAYAPTPQRSNPRASPRPYTALPLPPSFSIVTLPSAKHNRLRPDPDYPVFMKGSATPQEKNTIRPAPRRFPVVPNCSTI
jgi:hypothetical protein